MKKKNMHFVIAWEVEIPNRNENIHGLFATWEGFWACVKWINLALEPERFNWKL